VTAGLLLCARTVGEQLTLPFPSTAEILSATSATRSRAYEVAREIGELLPTLARAQGRPRAVREPEPVSKFAELRGEALRFVMSHPGCVRQERERMRYGDAWRLFVLELRDRHAELPLGDLADALCMPLGTLEDWMRAPAPEPPLNAHDDVATEHDAKLAQIETVLAAWRAWSGDFSSFCEHVRRDHRLEIGKTMIAEILSAHGERTPTRRRGRSRDEHALRGAFETFFPGAQWVGDGKKLEILVDGEVFRVNLELVVDAATDAAVGVAVTDEEDSDAVRDAFESGVDTTGKPPLAMLLDNRPSNHTPELDETLGDTMRIRATENRPQNKAHVEGAFGLFTQKTPPIEIETHEPRALARAIAEIVALTFFRAINRAPRRDRDGKTRVDLYRESVTPEQRDAARDALRERMRKQELARETRHARLDPDVGVLLDGAFARLDLLDPERHVRDAIACYSRDAIVDAIAIFSGKRDRGTLPAGVDARYLLGIARNLHHVHEADAITRALLHDRLDARDRFLAPLVRAREEIIVSTTTDINAILDALVDHLVASEREIDRHFWIDAIANVLPLEDTTRRDLAQRAARRIHAAFRLRTRERARLVRLLMRRLWPLQ
jgi:transposase InsO family protein